MAKATHVHTLRMTNQGTVLEKAKIIERLTGPEGGRFGRLVVEFADGTQRAVSMHPDFTTAIKEG